MDKVVKKERCKYDPTAMAGMPIGMFHCPECGEMVLAGLPHPDWDVLEGENPEIQD